MEMAVIGCDRSRSYKPSAFDIYWQPWFKTNISSFTTLFSLYVYGFLQHLFFRKKKKKNYDSPRKLFQDTAPSLIGPRTWRSSAAIAVSTRPHRPTALGRQGRWRFLLHSECWNMEIHAAIWRVSPTLWVLFLHEKLKLFKLTNMEHACQVPGETHPAICE